MHLLDVLGWDVDENAEVWRLENCVAVRIITRDGKAC
jgi:hypothetical protein